MALQTHQAVRVTGGVPRVGDSARFVKSAHLMPKDGFRQVMSEKGRTREGARARGVPGKLVSRAASIILVATYSSNLGRYR